MQELTVESIIVCNRNVKVVFHGTSRSSRGSRCLTQPQMLRKHHTNAILELLLQKNAKMPNTAERPTDLARYRDCRIRTPHCAQLRRIAHDVESDRFPCALAGLAG
jgi:hypothetical protein